MKITTISDGIVQLNQQHQRRDEEKAEIGGVYGSMIDARQVWGDLVVRRRSW
jgi:hypothetical protein